ncbi:xanthine dehydrogenase family protein molybdopterin-binding subunit [Engelhardtia mirabilis]|uniref:4-hydroxybenzoyl-CoA reductase subunit alpha n=1 Tax=Engelhardtia mirabilis TaxID=2528011 RepID=A0A518BNK3_9BACT|nr:4-hydroxybenzoyl-CoA reductase subunit alpha [Planctomycetes bacterium Pla133]QDV02876.1 4-hydroxybenzoyl-CoA reductase subunit alpha [Planctomycetes bacterium Pla86]
MASRDQHGIHPPFADADGKRRFGVIGKPLRKVDGIAKATGQAVYADDIQLPGMLHAKTLRSPHAHARIVRIDTSRAEALPGVHAVITGRSMPIPYGVIPWTPDENALAVDRVRFIGDEVAAVAAVDEDTANAALELIDVEYELLAVYLDPVEALENCTDAIHPNPKRPERGNLSKRVELDFGDVADGFERADVIVEDDYTFHGTTHTAIEPHCAVATYSPDKLLTLWSATQITHYVHRALARVLELPAHSIRVIQPCLGGAFGGKSDPFSLEFCVAKLAMITGRPVKMLWTREEVFYAHRGRHPMRLHYKTGATKDGKVTAVDAKILIDGGAYSSFGLVTTYYSGQLLTGPYDFPAYHYDSTRVFTNKPPCGPKRGHGSVQPRFAFEVQLDEVAEALAMDPIELRRANWQGEHTKTVNGQRITSNGFMQCLAEVERASRWKERRGKLPFGRGLGVAGSMYISGTNYPIYPNDMPQAGIQLKVDRSGLVMAFTGGNDIGQGSNTVVRTIVCEELGLEPDMVRVVAADTDLCPVDLGAYSSRVTFMVGNATIDAARKLRHQIAGAVAAEWEIDPGRIFMGSGQVFDLEDRAKCISSMEAFQIAEARCDTLGSTGAYNTPTLGGDYRGGTIGASPAYSFTAHAVEVQVDVETGRITVDNCWIAHDCGRALNPMLVAGQMEGSAYMGLAEAVLEHHDVNRFGLHAGPSLLDYRIPTSVDTPELHALIVESLDPEGPYGAKEAGEGPLHPSIPAISNAVFDAVGIRLRHLPFTPGKVLAALRERRAAETAVGSAKESV